jgi:hypothetical protein
MTLKHQVKPYWAMNVEELAEATQELDEEFVADKAKALSPAMRARLMRAKAKRRLHGRNGAIRLERMLEPVCQSLNLAAAQKLVRLKTDAKIKARVDQLARKCRLRRLTSAERSEYEGYLAADAIIRILQARARLRLRTPA